MSIMLVAAIVTRDPSQRSNSCRSIQTISTSCASAKAREYHGLSVNSTGDALGLWRTDKNASGNSAGKRKNFDLGATIFVCSAE
jgi:hypothetical protein